MYKASKRYLAASVSALTLAIMLMLLAIAAWSIAPDGHQYTVRDQEVHDAALGEWGILYDDLRVVEAGWQDSDLINVVAAVDSNGFPVSSVPSSLAGCRVLLLIC